MSTISTTTNTMQLRAIPDLLGKRYYIPEYQRGYRWEAKQIRDLLDDLFAFFTDGHNGSFYCLQPIVVKAIVRDGQDWYEVIDGQQRLTTLRVIMQVLDSTRGSFFMSQQHSYDILYATRPQMQGIFQSLSVIQGAQGKPVIDTSKNQWADSLDGRYIYDAASTVLAWFSEDFSRAATFEQYFYQPDTTATKSVQVVWYETVETTPPQDIFNRMNSLKVDLSCSELIRALFLSSATHFDDGDLSNLSTSVAAGVKSERRNHKIASINEKWDELEQQLRDTAFRAFLTRRSDTGRCAIGLLFDLMSGKHATTPSVPQLNKDDALYTYLFFRQLMDKDGDAWKTWERVLAAYDKLQAWRRDRDLFHRIGFLNAISATGREDETICHLLALNCGKRALRKEAQEMVKRAMTLPQDPKTRKPLAKLADLRYDTPTNYEYMKRLLLLYNVETARQQVSGDFFAFDLYRYVKGKKERVWTLEHIHAQNSECLPEDRKEAWREWADCNRSALRNLPVSDPALLTSQKGVLDELDYALSHYQDKTYTHDRIKAVFDSVAEFYTSLAGSEDKTRPMHQLSNMALLDLGLNAMVGKSAFEVKRQLLCGKIRDGEYLPVCTRKVFLKLYDEKTTQIHSWSQTDREAYFKDIREKLAEYFDLSVFDY